MRTKAFTLIESLLTLLLVLLPIYVFNVPNSSASKQLLNQNFINRFIHQQYISILKHHKQTMDVNDLNHTFSIELNQKGNVSRSVNLHLSVHESPIHISFNTGRIYESMP